MIRPALLALLLFALAPAAFAQAIPRTPEGRPDFQGVWDAPWLTPLERSAGVETLTVTEQQAAAIASDRRTGPFRNALNVPSPIDYTDKLRLMKIDGEYRTSQIIDPLDGRLPLTEAGRAIAAWVPAYTDPETIQLQSRCIVASGPPPMYIMPAETVRQIVQTPREVVIHSEWVNDLRIIPVGGRHRPPAMISAFGDPVARWDGDTLVIETTQFRADMAFRSIAGTRIILGPATRVVERLSFITPGELLYRFTVEDPAYYTRAWTGEYTLVRIPGRTFETACHEGNYAMTNLLRGARMEERRKAKLKR